ncbi:MAG: hypothetical protein A3A80_02730 [Candidatus Terrybacteria bacterium RIFCSPLOWO2_01_FULL_44_24]|nr:MAG: hypothetical protein A3B75_00475 [Candidatus Terrybacteria bacterium RIFCSPHIGHO2_02_FULL_43_14]OHA50984.1 MAG: hypothetical protein A3A80_02730 [Candidatus Terrybacteria bacterium RIFCSPLOWO2_01_FULL_44_24]
MSVRSITTYAVLIVAFALFPGFILANGVWERYVDGILVTLSAVPLSPLESEQVGFILAFLNPQTRAYLTDIPVARIEIEAFEVKSLPDGGPIFQNDNIVLNEGLAEFSYQFIETGIYDIHIIFKTPDGKEHNAGFLTSVRAVPKPTAEIPPPLWLTVATAIGSISGFVIALKLRRA